MGRKTLTVFAVLAMFLASSVCMACTVADSEASELKNVDAEPLIIDTNTTTKHFNEYNADYDKDTRTLTFNGGVEVNCKCTNSERGIVRISNLSSFTIVVKGETVLKSDEGLTHSSWASYGIKANYVDVLNIQGDGKLTLKPAMMTKDTNKSYARGIWVNSVFITGCTIDIDFSWKNYHNTCGIWAENKIYAYDTTINVKGNTTSEESHGLIAAQTVDLQYANYTASNVTVGIGPTFNKSEGTEESIIGTIYNSKVDITGRDNATNILVKCSTLVVDDTELTAKCGKYIPPKEEEAKCNYCIYSNIINIFGSDIKLNSPEGGVSRLMYYEKESLVKYSTLTLEGYGGMVDDRYNGVYSAIYGKESANVMNLEESTVSIKFTGVSGQEGHTNGIYCNIIFYHSDVKTECTNGYSFNPDRNVYFDDSTVGLQGSKTLDGEFKDITASELKDCVKVRVVSERLAYFDLNGGSGSAIPTMERLKIGQEIILPECDAKRGDLVFIGWDDGENLYHPGDKYVITESTYFTAVYDKADPKGIEPMTIVISMILVLAIAGLVGVAVYNKKQ